MLDRFLPGRLRVLWQLLLVFLVFSAAVRLGLAIYNGESSPLMPWRLVPALLIGLGFDVGVATFFLAPLGLLLLAWPNGPGRLLRWVMLALLLPLTLLMVFVGFSEFTFWNEFASRFNFIAVDYLIYTNEVVGNIRESYNLPLLLAGVGALTLALCGAHGAVAATALGKPAAVGAGAWPARWCCWPCRRWRCWPGRALQGVLRPTPRPMSWQAMGTSTSGTRSGPTRSTTTASTRPCRVPAQSRNSGCELASHRTQVQVSQKPQVREIVNAGPEKPLNVVMVSVESLSAEFLSPFGNPRLLTPALDRLAKEGLLFTRLYATGTRTVRGLEALTLVGAAHPGPLHRQAARQRQPVHRR